MATSKINSKPMSIDKGNGTVSRGTKSSNASLGIDATVASGISNASSGGAGASGGNVGSKQGQASLDDNYGPQSYSGRMGTQGSREDMTIGPKANRGEFRGGTTGGGGKEGMDPYGPGARKKGTSFNETGSAPGRGGSMDRARAGLKGGTTGGQASQATGANSKSMAKARSGIKGSTARNA